ncbi:enoyl-CoA hydratase/isomerase family protein [Ectothiorhodospira lacustris]|uniref:enoyl-CoA hydratase/isomerase family protein n=1 Tax=Ectothiorhodospira lacustris TaxID=2899127 RepID=UPI001EE8BF83|nr:enoyl-CoA hydratase/isomerase family protein [Ectothiorhodospira lacustris]MCG5501375.1 enoyl-CoA hydratase/isomerase family protein [Ectothiorhodospira lacustris]MCG5511245.1 enoyl-CoA hydratase/isomerase family protein [Ectothiorhodospira lacustris]MCG5522939.1 enoyl-CoA hydratase/isomerase family protein [Ectothiorhodospira lacustris]
MPDTSALTCEIRDDIAWITLNRPERHNAFDDALIRHLTETLRRVSATPAVRALVLAGAGKSFSAGADIGWMKRMAGYTEAENLADAQALGELMDTLYRLNQPTIARVHGAALGGGVGLVAACDLALATEQAHFCLSEVRLGLIPATISPYVIEAMGARQARRYFTTAERIDAQEAMRIGLIHQVLADEAALDAQILQTLNQIRRNGPEAMTAAKALVRDVSHRPVDAALVTETAGRIARIRAGREAQEGLGAFQEKRQPAWCPSEPA